MADWLAVYGAALSTVLAGWNIWRWRQDRRPQIRVAPLRTEVRGPFAATGDGPVVGGAPTLLASVANTGRETITVEAARIELLALAAAARFVELRCDGDGLIEPGARVQFTVGENELAESRSQLSLRVDLADGTSFHSETFGLDWSRAEGPPEPELKRGRAKRARLR